MPIKTNQSIEGVFPNKPITYDLFSENNHKNSLPSNSLVIFSHGFKGFKDWGCWDIVANQFLQNKLDFLKFNFSHNGIASEKMSELTDLIAFSNNNFTLQLNDLSRIIDYSQRLGYKSIFLIGHSMGGGLSIITAAEDRRVLALVTWASVNEFNRYFISQNLKKWEDDGILYIENSRTKQMLPIKYQLYQDVILHCDRLNIPNYFKQLSKPVMLFHGDEDQVVNVEDAHTLQQSNLQVKLKIIKKGNHTFGAKHPFEEKVLPRLLAKVVDETIKFFKQCQCQI